MIELKEHMFEAIKKHEVIEKRQYEETEGSIKRETYMENLFSCSFSHGHQSYGLQC